MTGHEFAKAHGDSTTWTATDFETEINLAEADALPAYRFLHSRKDPAPKTTDLTTAA